MKIKLLTFILTACFMAGCHGDDPTLEVSATSFNTDGQAASFTVNVTSDSDWSVESSAPTWCVPSTTKGSNSIKITLNVKANTEASSRTATVVLKAGKATQTITVTQGPKINTETYSYKPPVVFHILYANQSDRNQYVDNGRMSAIIAKVNAHYKAKTNPVSPSMNLEFVLATEDPDGNTLSEAGVHRLQVSNGKIDCEKFMNGVEANNSTYVKNLWNPNKYINVFVYTFTIDNILGIAHLPYTPTTNPLEGLTKSDYFFTNSPNYPHCVSLNNTYIYVENPEGRYTPLDVIATLSHELGHYLGLHHAFTEVDVYENGKVVDTITDACQDTDYCTDTPTYNSVEYNEWVAQYIAKTPQDQRTLSELATKYDCSGKSFTAYNLMDYAYCYSNQFTNQQHDRIRHVLANSPMIPGPKNTRAASRGPVETTPPPIIFKK